MQDDLVVQIRTGADQAELAADRLWQAGATAVGLDEQEAVTVLTASFPTNEAATTVAAEIGNARLVRIDPTWRDQWKQFAEPFDVGERLRVTPGWRQIQMRSGRTTVAIDPGYAFGSGSHASTRLLLAELDRYPPAGLDVLDLGCGSGILGVAAALLGARHIDAVDIDTEAIEATVRNAEANGVAARVTVADRPGGPYDLSLVNVTAAVHAEVGPAATASTRPGGAILLAGLLPGQWRHVAGAYAGCDVESALELDGWEGLRLRRST